MDHVPLSRLLTKHFNVEIDTAALADEALEKLRESEFDLVLINRKLGADYSDGMEIIRAMKADENLSAVPAMLVSNYPEAQQAAIAIGAERGFGKSELDSAQVVERLTAFLK
jgi:two-component system chemotaxis response regulator CheY